MEVISNPIDADREDIRPQFGGVSLPGASEVFDFTSLPNVPLTLGPIVWHLSSGLRAFTTQCYSTATVTPTTSLPLPVYHYLHALESTAALQHFSLLQATCS